MHILGFAALLLCLLTSLGCIHSRPTCCPFATKDRILFQGDSITDGNRGRNNDPNHILGHGYAFILAAKFGADYAEQDLVFINRGVSGNKVSDLAKRWEADAIDQTPNVLSILIGVNDLNAGVPADEFRSQYDELLTWTRGKLPGVKLIILEPFGLPTGKKKDNWSAYREELVKRQLAVKALALKHGATFVPLQEVFEEAATRVPAEHWIWDGVHPTYSGHQLIADAWERALRANAHRS